MDNDGTVHREADRGALSARHIEDPPVFTISEIAHRVRREHRRLPRSLRIRCARTNAVSYRDYLESLLWIGRCRIWQWVDGRGGVADGQSAAQILARLALDALAWPWLYLRHRTAAAGLGRSPSLKAPIINPSRALYLRTDHIFDQTAGGSVTHTQGVIGALRGHGLRVDVVSTDRLRGVPVDGDFHGVEPVYRLGRNLPNMPELGYNDQLIRWIDGQWPQLTPDFLYQRSSRGNYTGALLSRRRRVPLVYEYNGSLVWVSRHWGDKPEFHETLLDSVELANLRSADLIVVVSEPLRQELLGRGLPDRKILVNPNGVDTDIFRPDIDGMPIRGKIGLGDGLVIGFIGTFGAWHGAEVLADAFGLLLQRWPRFRDRVRLYMIGNGQKMPLVARTLEQHGVVGDTVLAGAVPQEDGPAHLAACDILVSPHVPNPDGSRFFGSPTKLFEYMAMGRGIVASDLEQIGEVLEHGRTGWLVEPGDAGALAEGLRVLIEDEPLRARLGAAARRQAESQFTWHRHTRRILDALNEQCGDGSADGRPLGRADDDEAARRFREPDIHD